MFKQRRRQHRHSREGGSLPAMEIPAFAGMTGTMSVMTWTLSITSMRSRMTDEGDH
ncbi:MAG: hypothetical protein KIT69_06080 [Propionibacteriaceae bacterium]|nr:hypothetical protein [Propionibacteriaceae bacterium]